MAAYDLVLKGGHVVDPGQSIDAKMDVAFRAGKVGIRSWGGGGTPPPPNAHSAMIRVVEEPLSSLPAHGAVPIAFDHDFRVGGILIARDTPGVDMLEGRADLALLLYVRVHPARVAKGASDAH